MAQGQGKSSFETGTNPLAVVCIQLAGSAGARPMELVGVGGVEGQQNWDVVVITGKDGSCVLEPLLTVGISLAEK